MALLHIFGGLLAITAGFAALFAMKGGRLHRRAGTVFVGAMIVMASMGGVMAAMKWHLTFQKLNVIAATVSIYLVITALLTVRRGHPRWIDAGVMFLALAVGLFSVALGLEAVNRPKVAWFPGVPALIFGTVALLAAYGDLRIVMGRVLEGPRRIARHLWRMCFAMFIATGSFFLGQAQVFPEPIRILPMLAAPVFLVLGLMVYWWVRVSIRKHVPVATTPAAASLQR